jgi:uncharacterized protein (DUF111 family)
VSLRILTSFEHRETAARILFQETSTFGLRSRPVERHCLRRAFESVATPFGEVRVKIGYWGDEVLKVTPEYEECRERAEAAGLPVGRVYQAAVAAIERQYFKSK